MELKNKSQIYIKQIAHFKKIIDFDEKFKNLESFIDFEKRT